MAWVKSESNIKPDVGRVILAYCPEWSGMEYQVCMWNGRTFTYEEQPNEDFHEYVDSWSIFLEADY